MLNQVKDWVFRKSPSRPALSKEEAHYWKDTLHKLLKVGIEIELNLEEPKGSCRMDNYYCPCVAQFTPENPMPNTSNCFEQCTKWDNGNCEIAKNYGCAGLNCIAFSSPCPSCNKYDRGCKGCEYRYREERDPKRIREHLSNKLKPTNFVGQFGANGVYKVCKDGSLKGDGGVEVATVGVRVDFWHIHSIVKNIMDACREKGAYVNERCSIHIHMLTSYLRPDFDNDEGSKYLQREITELEKPVPEIILANFHQLVRRYHCALIWMSMTGNSLEHLTRWEKFRKPILNYSAARTRMPLVVTQVGGASKDKRKYSMINYEQMLFDQAGTHAKRFHIEARYMDGNLSPSTVAAHACLLYGLMLKAAEISRFGVLESGTKEYMQLQKEIYTHLCNNDGSYGGDRRSDTSCLDPYIPNLIEQSLQLVRVVQNTLANQGASSKVLLGLSKKPLAYRLIEGQEWEDIENDFVPQASTGSNEEITKTLDKIIQLSAVSECETKEEWLNTITELLMQDTEAMPNEGSKLALTREVSQYIESKTRNAELHWSDEVKSYVAR